MPERGRFFVIEGIDGAGTTTQARRLAVHLSKGLGRRAAGTREPSDGPVGRLIREILLGRQRGADGATVGGDTMALLFAADRRDHLGREIEPLLAGGSDVVSDRYLMSSLAYQAEEADRSLLAGLARGILQPDLTLLIDVPVEVAARRRRAAGRVEERYDGDRFLAAVAENYRRLARAETSIAIIDGAPPEDEVARAIASSVDDFLARAR